MSRIARIVVPDVPHHVTQRGNRRQNVFLADEDYAVYLDLLSDRCRAHAVPVWGYCLMPNHIHLMIMPSTTDALARVVGEVHRRYTGHLNARLRVTGHLFQGRFGSIAMGERHTRAATRYIALNPVSAGLVEHAREWRWSSARAHLSAQDDVVVTTAPLLDRIENFAEFLATDTDPSASEAVSHAPKIGRPLLDADRLSALEQSLGKTIRPRKRGPKPKRPSDDDRETLDI